MLMLTRTFDAEPRVIFGAWTDPQLVAEWWGPKGVTNPVCELHVRPGGTIHIVMKAGKELGELEGTEWPMRGVFEEVTPFEKLVFKGEAIIDEKPILETKNTVTLHDEGGKTKMEFHVEVLKATPEAEQPLEGMEMGWSQSFDKLGELIARSA